MSEDLDTLIHGAKIITGDGKTSLERGFIALSNTTIRCVQVGDPEACVTATDVIDATGCVVLPGIINAHAHGCIFGPSMPSGSVACPREVVNWHRNRHLLSGTTTLLNVCGLALPDEIFGGELHPLEIAVSTAHTPSNIRAAQCVDGTGLRARHLHTTIDDALSAGAKALGEVGGGQTLGGGAQEYRFIPEAIKRVTGRDIPPSVSRKLRNAVVGRYLRPQEGVSDEKLQEELSSCGLAGVIDPSTVRALVLSSVMPSVGIALVGFDEVAFHSERTGYPAIFHNSAPSVHRLLEVANKYPGAKIIAGHSNHPMFLPQEAVSFADELKRRNVTIDASTLDCINTRWRNGPENFDALIEAGSVDTISTDYAAGHWDGILEAIHRIICKRQMSPPAAVALATGNVARAFPQLAGDRGLIEVGKRADLIIVDFANFARVRDVIIGGKRVVRQGVMVPCSASG